MCSRSKKITATSVAIAIVIVIMAVTNRISRLKPIQVKTTTITSESKVDTNKSIKTKEDIYFESVISELKEVDLSEAIPEVTKNKSDVFLAATVSCSLKSTGMNPEQIKKTIAADPRAKPKNTNEQIVLDIIIEKALSLYC